MYVLGWDICVNCHVTQRAARDGRMVSGRVGCVLDVVEGTRSCVLHVEDI